MVNFAAAFSATYTEARSKFLVEVARAGASLQSLPHPRAGPCGEQLFLDAARIGDPASPNFLVIMSGTHGVEGHCGSGAQIALLREGLFQNIPGETAVLLLHAVNPYGFAWSRRVTHENVDLNRNWVDFDQPLPANPGYDEINAILCPREWTSDAGDRLWQALVSYSETHGEPALRRATSGGQYRHPAGLFYGGDAPSWSRRAQTQIFETFLKNAETVAILDIHSGLGPPGFGERLTTFDRGTPQFESAARWYGTDLTSTVAGGSASPPIAGDGLSAAPHDLSQANVIPIAIEFGTRPRRDVVPALCGDAWLHSHGDPHSRLGLDIRQKLRDAFYCDDDSWKAMVVVQTRLAAMQALSGLK